MSTVAVAASRLEATTPRTLRAAALCLIGAAAIFGVSWYFMPAAGITDTREIFRIVTPQRGEVLAAAIMQLVSAALFVPSMIGLIRHRELPFAAKVWLPASVVVLGTLGLAADAMDHLLSYAMTSPGVDREAMVEVMEFMQGPGLLLIVPLIGCFFVGAAWLSFAYAKAGEISRWNPGLYAVALVVGVGGAMLEAATDLVDARTVGLATLWTIAAAQLWLGVAVLRRQTPRV
jgi:hypothetical protein